MSIQDAIQLAQIEMPNMYMSKPETPWYRRIFRRPGPKPKLGQVTYRGPTPPMLSKFFKDAGEFRQDSIAWETINQMRRNPMVKLATIIRASPILIALRNVKIECEDPKIAAFIEEVFVKEMMMELALTSIIPSYQFGTSPHEKVWESRDVKAVYVDEDGEEVVAWNGPALVYKKIKFVHPQSLEKWLLSEDTKSFEGFKQITEPGEPERIVEAYKAFIYVNRFLYGGFWGESEYQDVYAWWYYSEFFGALKADYLRFKAIPPIIGWAPTGKEIDQDGNEVDNLIHAGEILLRAFDNLVTILPYDPDERGNNQWGYKELQMGDHSEVFTRAIEELDIKILRGMIVPERTVTQNIAAVGSYNQASVHTERMLDAGKVEVDNFLKACTIWAIPQLIEDNFGPKAAPCRLFSRGISEELKEKFTNIVITILQNDKESFFSRQVAFTELLDVLNIPYTLNPEGFPDPETPTDEAEPAPEEEAEEDDA